MNTSPALPHARRRRTTTYGKASRNSSSWDALTSDENDKPGHTSWAERTTFLNEHHRPQYSDNEPQTVKRALEPRQNKSRDAWDVPSSDEETDLSIPNHASPLKRIPKRKLLDLGRDSEPALTPWERQKSRDHKHELDQRTNTKSSFAPSVVAAQARVESTGPPLQLSPNGDRSPTKRLKELGNDHQVSMEQSSPRTSAATARLQAKRLHADRLKAPTCLSGSNASKSLAKHFANQNDDNTEPSPRKRPRPEPGRSHDLVGSEERDVASLAQRDQLPEIKLHQVTETMDVFEVPDTSADESVPASKFWQTPRMPSSNKKRKLTTYSSPRRIDTASKKLHDVHTSDTDTTPANPSSSPSMSPAPPDSNMVSPPATPATITKMSTALTPKQAMLWDELLPEKAAARTPSVLRLEGLTLKSSNLKSSAAIVPRASDQLSSEVRSRRSTKLVDRLRTTGPSMSNQRSTNADDTDRTSDTDMDSGLSTDDDETTQSATQSQSQSHSQGTSAKTGLKVTYAARTRSYLPEDSFEDDLMFDLSNDMPQHTSTSQQSSSKNATQNSVFELDESDDEAASGKLRSIHELRAGGGNQRFMNDIGGLMEDIKDRKISGRSRRRTALIELATRMVDNVFAGHFFRQSCEERLVQECNAPPDEIADFALAAAFAAMMATEQPEHIAQVLKDAGVLHWLARRLDDRTNMKELCKERRINMSKSAQGTFVSLTVRMEVLIRGDEKSCKITPRVIALKACDGIIRRLRKSGETTELMKGPDLQRIVPGPAEIDIVDDANIAQITLAISTLESLSLLAASLDWPSSVMKTLRLLMTSALVCDSRSTHLHFLMLRLLTNLTNENTRNCEIFSTQSAVLRILRTISNGFDSLHSTLDEAQRTVNFDILILATGLLINLTEHNDSARECTTEAEARPVLELLIEAFQQGQRRMLEAESEEQGFTNVVYGYLAVVLANVCRNAKAREVVRSRLPDGTLSVLVDALEEFVAHNERVDTQNFDGEEGASVWSVFTDKLKRVLGQLKAVV